MSKLNIKDLESIKNGKLTRFNLNEKENYEREITLTRLNNQIQDLRTIRTYILENFKNDVKNEFDKLIGSRIEEHKNIEFDPRMLFLPKYLFIKIPTMFGKTECLVSENGIESTSFDTVELNKKVKLILPYIKGILNVKNNSNILDNAFYEYLNIYNETEEKVLVVNGDGIVLPFREYQNLDISEYEDLLNYYYTNWNKILQNSIIPDSDSLDKFRTNVSSQKALALYKGLK